MNSSYKDALRDAKVELAEMAKQRADLDKRIEGLKFSIAGLEALCNETPVPGQLLDVAGITALGEDASLSDSIRSVIASSLLPVSATAIRDYLVAEGYDPNQYSNFLTVIHNTLNRLARQGEIRMIRTPFGLGGNGWVCIPKDEIKDAAKMISTLVSDSTKGKK